MTLRQKCYKENKKLVIAIDGTVCSGKSSIAMGLANRLGFKFCGTGSIYRAITLKVMNHKVKEDDIEKIIELLKTTQIKLFYKYGKNKLYLDGRDVTKQLRSPEINKVVVKIAALPRVREFVQKIQHQLGDSDNIVVEGRDIGTIVFPNAEIKIYLSATDEVRTRRRLEDYKRQGRDVSYDEALKEILTRDEADMHRRISPLKQAEDSIFFDNSDYTLDQALDTLEKLIRRKLKLTQN